MGTKKMTDKDFCIAINEGKMDDLILLLNGDIDYIFGLLSDLQMEFYNLNEFFKGDVADTIQEKWNVYNKMLPLLKANLSTYSDDMVSVKALLGEIDMNSKNLFETYTKEDVVEEQNEYDRITEMIANQTITEGNVNQVLSSVKKTSS